MLDWALPRICATCARPIELIPIAPAPGQAAVARGWCTGCAASLPGARAVRCPVCGERARGPVRAGQPCARCRAERPAFDRTIVLADYAPPLDHLIQAIKFGRRSALAAPLGNLLALAVLRTIDAEPQWRPTRIAAIPLAPARLASRGFNQAALMAMPIARGLELRPDRTGLQTGLQRVRQGAPASSLDAAHRRDTLAHAFAATGIAAGSIVLVVDDVMTTGATLEAAAAALKTAGAAVVVNCVAARTRAPSAHSRMPSDDGLLRPEAPPSGAPSSGPSC